jgi:hypothetical protein
MVALLYNEYYNGKVKERSVFALCLQNIGKVISSELLHVHFYVNYICSNPRSLNPAELVGPNSN